MNCQSQIPQPCKPRIKSLDPKAIHTALFTTPQGTDRDIDIDNVTASTFPSKEYILDAAAAVSFALNEKQASHVAKKKGTKRIAF